jgi:hypothetical protein
MMNNTNDEDFSAPDLIFEPSPDKGRIEIVEITRARMKIFEIKRGRIEIPATDRERMGIFG